MTRLLIAITKKHEKGVNNGYEKLPNFRRCYRTRKTRFVISNTLNVAKVVIHAGFI